MKFDAADSFHENVAVVKVDGKWGLIAVDGHFVVPAIYDDIDEISYYQGTIIVKTADKYGLVSITGQEIIPAKYAAITDCTAWPSHGLLAVKRDGKWGVYDRTGQEIAPISYDEIYIDYDGIIRFTPLIQPRMEGYVMDTTQRQIGHQNKQAGIQLECLLACLTIYFYPAVTVSSQPC